MASNLENETYYDQRNENIAESTSSESDLSYGQIAEEVQYQIDEKPISSAAIAVSVGIGAGLLLSTLLSSERAQKERFARRVGNYLGGSGNLRSSIESFLPNSVTDRYFS